MSKRVLVFGENDSDRQAIKELIAALCPGIGPIEVRRHPLVLIKGARPENVGPNADKLAEVVAFDHARSPVSCVFAHEDCDALEPAQIEVSRRIEEALTAALRRERLDGCSVHAVAPAWEIENWWMQWPEQVAGLVKGWRVPGYAGRDVGKIANGKETLTKDLRPAGKRNGKGRSGARPRDYRESDGPEIARVVRAEGVANDPRATSASYERFRASVRDCCSA